MSESDKSGKPELTAKSNKPLFVKPQLYAYYFDQLKVIAREYGYNLVIHGSMNRDCDLIAIPWVDEPRDEFDMINAFAKALTGYTTDRKYRDEIYLFKQLPGGRHAYVINLNRGGYKDGEDENGIPKYVPDPQYYIDISIPQTGGAAAQARIAELEARVKYLEELASDRLQRILNNEP